MTTNTDNCKKIEDAFCAFNDACRLVMFDDDCDFEVSHSISAMLDMTSDGLADVQVDSSHADIEDDEPEYEHITGHEMGLCSGRV